MHVARRGESSRRVTESRAELGFRTPAEAGMQNGDEQALPGTPNWGPFKIPTEDQSWFSSGATQASAGPARGQRGPLKRGKWQEDVEQLWDLEHKSAHGDSFMQKWAILSQTASVQSPCRCCSTTLQRYICIYVVSRWPVPLQVSSWLVRCFKLEGWSN